VSGGRGTRTTTELVRDIKAADEDYEFYPTSVRIVEIVARQLDKSADSIMDIGAGDGRVLTQLAERFTKHGHTPLLYAIEKSMVLVQAQPENVIPVGTDLFEQNLACLPVDYIFSNPIYSQYETWACIIIETGHARKAFLVIPQRWKDSAQIALALKKRRATARVLGSDDFYDAPRRSRAVIDIVEISYPRKNHSYGSHGLEDYQDPFDQWFDANISTFDAEEQGDPTDYEQRQEALARVRKFNTIEELVSGYGEEYSRMEANYRAIFQLDYELLHELGVSKDNVREGIKKKMSGLKSKYWTVLFERLDAITNRLSTATKKEFLERLVGRSALAFTIGNAYAVVLWAIKNANQYFDAQTVQLYRDLSTFEGVLKYKSNVRAWDKNGWRYLSRDERATQMTCYALDYRIVVERYNAIFTGDFGRYDYPGGLSKSCHETIADVIAVLFNLGFPALGGRSMDLEWHSGVWRDWYQVGKPGSVLFQVKAHKNGNLHFRFLPAAIKALNVTAGRLLGWLKSADEVVEELGYTPEETAQYYSCLRRIEPGSVRLLLGDGDQSGNRY